MRRDQIISAVENLTRAIETSGVYKSILAATRPGKENVTSAVLFSAYARFMVDYSGFGFNEKYLMKAFGIEPLLAPEFWEKFVKPDGPHGPGLEVRRGMTFLRDFLPTVIAMLGRESDRDSVLMTDSEKGADTPTERIKFYVRDPDTPTLTLKHFATILKSIEELHTSIELIEEIKHTELLVASLDSGSDKEFDLLGVASAVKKLSETLLEVWNRIQSAKATKAKVNYSAACEGINVLVKLNVAEQKSAVSKEQAESIRRNIINSIAELFENGVYTEAMEGQTVAVPSSLPVERRRLLTHQAAASNGELSDPDVEELDAEV